MEKNEQISLFKEQKSETGCEHCKFFAELKIPYERSDGAIIYGYCFMDGDKDHSPNMGKGYAVFVPNGTCKKFKRKAKAKGVGV